MIACKVHVNRRPVIRLFVAISDSRRLSYRDAPGVTSTTPPGMLLA